MTGFAPLGTHRRNDQTCKSNTRTSRHVINSSTLPHHREALTEFGLTIEVLWVAVAIVSDSLRGVVALYVFRRCLP